MRFPMTKAEKLESSNNSRHLAKTLITEISLKFLEFCADTKIQRGTQRLQLRSEDENAL